MLDRAALAGYARVRLGLRAVRAQADEQAYVVAALACDASQVHVAELPPSFTTAELAEELGRLQGAGPGERALVTGYSEQQFAQIVSPMGPASVQLAIQSLLELQVVL